MRAKQQQEREAAASNEGSSTTTALETAPADTTTVAPLCLEHSKSVPALPSPDKLKGLSAQPFAEGDVAVGVVDENGAALPPPQMSPRA